MGLQPELQVHRPPTRIPERGSGYHDTGIGVSTYRAPTTVTIVAVAGNILPPAMHHVQPNGTSTLESSPNWGSGIGINSGPRRICAI